MSVIKQLLLSIVVLVIAGGFWYAWDRNMIPFLPHNPPRTAGQAGFPGGPGGFPGPGGVALGGPGAPGGAANARAAAPIVAAAVTLEDDGFEVTAIGTVAASKAITIYPQVTGVVVSVAFQPGMPVKEGQPILKLTDTDQTVAQQKMKVALDSAQAAYDRSEQLAKANTVTAAALSDAKANLTKAQIDYQTATLDLAKRTVVAPFSGTTGLSDVTVGDLVTSNKALTTLDDLSTVEVSFDVPERASGRVAVGQEVKATTAALPGKTFMGTISAVDSRVDATARTLRVEAKLPNDANVLKPGMAVTVTMEFPGDMRPVVPSLSIQYDRAGAYVWRVENGVVHRVGVSVIDRRSGTVIVEAALKPGEMIASEGIQRLRENARVNVVDDGSGNPLPQTPTPVASATPEPTVTPTGVAGAPAGANRPQGAAGTAGGNRPQGAGAAGQGQGGQGAPGAAAAGGNRPQGAAGNAANGGTGFQRQGTPAGTAPAGGAPAAAGTGAAPPAANTTTGQPNG